MPARLLLTLVAVTAVAFAPGCGSGPRAPLAQKPDTAIKTGAVCDTTLDTTAAAAAQPETRKPEPVKQEEPKPQKPRPEPTKAAEAPRELPRMWDFGSEKCIPCKTMKEILDPMIADYNGKVDIRIINVYEEPELTRRYRISVIPTQVFIDATGKELFRHIGVYPRDSIEARFRELGMPVVTGAVTPPVGSDCLA